MFSEQPGPHSLCLSTLIWAKYCVGEVNDNIGFRASSLLPVPGGWVKESCKMVPGGAGEMIQKVKALTVLLEVLSSNPSNHLVVHNHL